MSCFIKAVLGFTNAYWGYFACFKIQTLPQTVQALLVALLGSKNVIHIGLNLTTYSPSPIHHFPCIAYGRIPTGSNSCSLVS